MKVVLKISSVLLICFFTFSGCEQKEKHEGYIISGTIKGLENDGWAKLIKPPVFLTDTIKVLDSTKIVNGNFQFKGKVDHIDMVQLKITPKNSTYFFLDNSDITVSLDLASAEKGSGFVSPKIKGSKTQALYELQRSKLDSIRNQEKYNAFVGFREEVMAAKRSKDKALMEQIKTKMTALEPLETEQQEELKNFKIQFLKDNPSSPVAVQLMGLSFSEITMTREEMKSVYNLFQGDAKKANKFRVIKKTYEDYVEKFAPGATAPDFTLKTVSGDDLTLSNVKAKYILVDFWASWCVPCRASFPKLKKVYNTYKDDGFEVVAVATGDKDKNWRDAIQKDQTPWLHVFDVNEKSVGRNGDVADAYGVPFLPTTYLLDSNLKIILRNPTKEELDTKLKELFRS